MTDKIPNFREGDPVRVMQTDEMVRRGLANKTGVIDTIWQDGDWIVLLDDAEAKAINGCHLMRMAE